MPTLAKAAALLQEYDPSIYVLVPAGLGSFEHSLENILHNEGVKGMVIPANKVDSFKPNIFVDISKFIKFY